MKNEGIVAYLTLRYLLNRDLMTEDGKNKQEDNSFDNKPAVSSFYKTTNNSKQNAGGKISCTMNPWEVQEMIRYISSLSYKIRS